MLSVIVPYRVGEPVGEPPEGDETLWMDSQLGIGEQRIRGALEASHEWLVHVDADGRYPDDFLERIRGSIASGEYPDGFWCVRRGGFQRSHLESGLVVRRALFLERVQGFAPDHRRDVGRLFTDLPVNEDVAYRHGLTLGEKRALLLLLLCLA